MAIEIYNKLLKRKGNVIMQETKGINDRIMELKERIAGDMVRL